MLVVIGAFSIRYIVLAVVVFAESLIENALSGFRATRLFTAINVLNTYYITKPPAKYQFANSPTKTFEEDCPAQSQATAEQSHGDASMHSAGSSCRYNNTRIVLQHTMPSIKTEKIPTAVDIDHPAVNPLHLIV